MSQSKREVETSADVAAAGPPSRLDTLVERACSLALPALTTAVVHPVDARTLEATADAARRGLISPVLVGPTARIAQAAEQAQVDISDWPLVATPHSHEAAERAVALAAAGDADALMKGALHTDELMAPLVARESGLRTERRISHAFIIDEPTYPRLMLLSDAAVNIEPDLDAKRDIAQNAIDCARALGIATPRVAVLSAVETVTAKLRSSVEAAALCKMADRRQIVGGLLDGPLAFDNAVSTEAARAKHIVSAVAGQADVLLVPNLECGNMLAKQLEYLAGARLAGIVLGARVPVMLTSRADPVPCRVASCAVAVLYRDWQLRNAAATTAAS